jgi:DNA-binding protein HU-beta
LVPRATHRDIVSLLVDVYWAGVPENQLTLTNKKTARVFLETLSALAYKKRLKKNGEFVLPGFGKLVKQKRKARTGFNPKTQQKIKIPAKTVVKFRVAKAAKDAVLGVKK